MSGCSGFSTAAAVVDVLPEHGFGEIGLAEVPENRAESFGGFERDRIDRADRLPRHLEITPCECFGLVAASRSIEQDGHQIVGAKGIAVARAVNLCVEPEGGLQMGRSLVVLAERKINAADRLANSGLHFGLTLEPTAELRRERSIMARTVRSLRWGSSSSDAPASRRRVKSSFTASAFRRS